MTINIEEKSISVTDEINLLSSFLKKGDTIAFYLRNNFDLTLMDENYPIKKLKSAYEGINKYMIENISTEKDFKLTLKYSGILEKQKKSSPVKNVSGVKNSLGIISGNGVYLNGSTIWVPTFGTELFTFKMTVHIDKEWGIVSQGNRTVNEIIENERIVTYEALDPTNEVFLVASKWHEFNYQTENVLVQAFLGENDEKLANKYLKTTEHYLKIYDKLIGSYPYKKFALVENFWETGYGMPSFTLLGKKIIRLPFILNTSYPHELLHNWWGNGVYIDYSKGNWSEGLTAYMADHLIKEQNGQGEKYRRTALEKYTKAVNKENDFPIKNFRSRNSRAEGAIGYEKVMMVNEMLRDMLGDKLFIDSYAKFYENFKFKKASFDDIQKTFEEVSGMNLQPFFYQWIMRPGAPMLKLSDVNVKKDADKFNLSFNVLQVQEEDPFLLFIPVAVYFEEDEPQLFKIGSGRREKEFSYSFDKKPLKIEIDPQVNVFRRLDENEVPPKLSLMLKSKETLVVLPKKSKHFDAYNALALTWQKRQEVIGNKMTITTDEKLKKLNTNVPVWIIGYENKFANGNIVENHFKNSVNEIELTMVDETINTGSLVYVYLNGKNKKHLAGFIGSNSDEAIKLLTTKLNYYSSYSYAGFEGVKAKNILKGIFPPLNSPLSYTIKYAGKSSPIKITLQPRKALAN